MNSQFRGGRSHHFGRLPDGDEFTEVVTPLGFSMNRPYAPLREISECSCGGTFVPAGYMAFGDASSSPSGFVVPPYHLTTHSSNYGIYSRPGCPQPTPSPFASNHGRFNSANNSSNAAANGGGFLPLNPRPQTPAPTSAPAYRRMPLSGVGFDPTIGGCTTAGGRPFLDMLMGVGVQEGVPTVMPIRFVQSTNSRDGDTTFELHCSSENMEKLKRLLREAETRGRGRALEGYLCPAERPNDERL